MNRVKAINSYMLRGLQKLQKECDTDGFLTHEENVVCLLLQRIYWMECSPRSAHNLPQLDPLFTGRTELLDVPEISSSNIYKVLYAHGLLCHSTTHVMAVLKYRNALDFADVDSSTYEIFLRSLTWIFKKRVVDFLRMDRPHCILSFQELFSPCGKPLMLMYVTFTPAQMKEQVTLFLGMIPIELQENKIGQRHEQLLRDLNDFIFENQLGEYLAECLVSVNATPACAEHELLIGDCLLAVMNNMYRSQENRVVWCCNPKVVFHRVVNALHFIFSRRSYHRSATSHRFSEMFQFSLHFVIRLQTFCLSYKQQIEQVMKDLNLSLSFPHLFFTHKIVATSFQRMGPNASMFYLPALIEDLPIVHRVLQMLVTDEANWTSNVRMCSKAWILRRVMEQPKFIPFMILLKKTVQVFDVFEIVEESFDCLSKRDKHEILKKSLEQIQSGLHKLKHQFPSSAFSSYEIQTKAGQWMSLNRHDNVSLGFNAPCDRPIRYKLGNDHYVYFAKSRFIEDAQIDKMFNTLGDCTKSSFCKYAKDYSLLSTFMAIDFLPLCEPNRNQYFDLIMDEIKHFSSYDATEVLCESWLQKDCPRNNTKMDKKKGNKTYNNNGIGNLNQAKLDTLFFEDYYALSKGAHYVNKLPTLTDEHYADTAEAFLSIAYNGVSVDRFNLTAEDLILLAERGNGKTDEMFTGNTKDDFTDWLFAM